MQHRFFSLAQLALLGRPETWRLISAALPEETAPVAHARHTGWMRANTHAHAHQELLFVLAGEGQHGYNGDVYPLAPGTLLLLDQLEPHDCFVPPWAPDADHLWIMVVQDRFIVHLLSVRDGALVWSKALDLWLTQESVGVLADRCLAGLHAPVPPAFRRPRVLAAASAVLAAVVEAGFGPDEVERRDDFQAQVVRTVQQHIRDTAGKGVNLDHLARITGYSKFHFLRLFTRYTGLTVHAYIDRCRHERARAMTDAGYTKTAIADALGFSALSAYSRWERRER